MSLSIHDVYVLVSYDYYGLPSCDEVVYETKKEAHEKLLEIKKTWRGCDKKVKSLSDFFDELRSWEAQDEEW